MAIKDWFIKSSKTITKKFSGFNVRNFLLPPKMYTKDYLTSYSESGWLYACTNKIAQSVAESKVTASKTLRNGNVKIVNDSKVMELLKNPNPFQSQYEFMELSDMLLSLTGKCFWYVAKDNMGQPQELWIMSPQYVSIVPDEEEFIKGFVYNATGQAIPLERDEVIFVNIPDPYDMYNGIGPAQAAGFAIETDKYANKWNRNFFFNNATPDTVVLTEGTMDDDTYERVKASWNEAFGGVDNARKAAILEQIKDVKMLSTSARDMDFVNLKNTTRDEILAVFGVPKVLLGMTENVNRATAETAKLVFDENVVQPRLKRLEDKINNELVPLFGEQIEIQLTSRRIINPDFVVSTINEGFKNGYISSEVAKEQIGHLLGIEIQ